MEEGAAGPDPRIVLSWSRWDGNGVTLVVYIGHITEFPITLLYLPYVQGFNHCSSPPPTPACPQALSCSESAIHSFV